MEEVKNLIKCNTCNSWLIMEEVATHECFTAKDLWVIDGKIWIGDGTRYYPYYHSQMNTQNETRKDGTECLIRYCCVIECCKMSVNL